MEQLRNAFESLRNWWFDLHYSKNQKRSLLIVSAVLIVLSIFIVARGNTQVSAPIEITPITIAEPEIIVDVHILDMEYPPFNDEKIKNIREKMAKVGNFKLSRVSNRDVKS